MNIIDKIMNALSLYDEEEIIEEEVEQKPAKTEQEPAKPKKRFFGSKEPAAAAPAEEPKRERKSILNFKGSAAKPEPVKNEKMGSKTINLPIADKLMTVVLLEPVDFNDSPKIADYLRDNQAVVVNYDKTDNVVAKRMTDFISGTVYAIGGSMKKLGRNIVICAPKNVDIDAGEEIIHGTNSSKENCIYRRRRYGQSYYQGNYRRRPDCAGEDYRRRAD